MHNLFIWCLPLHSKDFYLIINILDIVLCACNSTFLRQWLWASSGNVSRDTMTTVMVIFMIIAIVALVLYFTERGYRHVIHKIYMFFRLFVTIFVFIMLIINFVSSIGNIQPEHVIPWVLYGFLNFLNLYWSLELMKIIN